jgi:hypothetical protein
VRPAVPAGNVAGCPRGFGLSGASVAMMMQLGAFARPVQVHKYPLKKEKGGLWESPPCPCRPCPRIGGIRSIPTPPRAATKLFDACVQAPPRTWMKAAGLAIAMTIAARAPFAKPIVNLTLTTQSRRHPRQKRLSGIDAAKPVLHNNQGISGAPRRDRFVPVGRTGGRVQS